MATCCNLNLNEFQHTDLIYDIVYFDVKSTLDLSSHILNLLKAQISIKIYKKTRIFRNFVGKKIVLKFYLT